MVRTHRVSYILPDGHTFTVESASSEWLGEVAEALKYQYPAGTAVLSQHVRKAPVDASETWSRARCEALAEMMVPGERYGAKRYGSLKLDSESEMRVALSWMEQYGLVQSETKWHQTSYRRTKK